MFETSEKYNFIRTYLVPGVFEQFKFRTFNVNNESSQLPCAFASGKYIRVLNLAPISKLQFVPFVWLNLSYNAPSILL